MPSSPTPLTWKVKFILVVVVPACFLLGLEVLAWLALTFGVGSPSVSAPTALEMPTWMMHDANAMARRKPSADAMDWLKMFKEGNGFRVHLTPNINHSVKNTFSLIPSDAERRYLIQANSLGFRGPELTPKKSPGTFRITVFGDSSSFGWGVNAQDSWSVLLQQGLQKKFPDKKIEVGNFAVPGDSSAYGRLIFDTFAPRFESDLVILGFGANDAKPVLTSHTEQVARFQNREGLLRVAQWLRKSSFYRLLESLTARKPTIKEVQGRPRVPAVTPKDYGANLRYMAARGEEIGSKNTLLLTLCTPSNYSRRARGIARQDKLLWLNGQAALIKAIPDIAAGKLYPDYVEKMKASYPRELAQNRFFYVTSDGCHPNELGHRLVADRLTEVVGKSVLLH